MHRRKINQKSVERCLLTEIAPYETPMVFSNWGAFNYCKTLSKSAPPSFLSEILEIAKFSIPYGYRIKKDGDSYRSLSLAHPGHSARIVEFYRNHDVLITKLCKRSLFSLRAPHKIARFFILGKGEETPASGVEDVLTAESAFAASYFTYSRFSHLRKFFESDEFTELEKRFSKMLHLDIVKCFPSIYTHSISWAVRGKMSAKDLDRVMDKSNPPFDSQFDKLLQALNHNETNGIIIGPELCRIFAEIILQRIDANLHSALSKKGCTQGAQYWCYRYIDDYFYFFSDDSAKDMFMKTLSEELERYKLYLNNDKISVVQRPFITDISVQKIRLSEYVNQLSERLKTLPARRSQHEINRLRAIAKERSVPFADVSNFLISSLKRQLQSITPEKAEDRIDAIYILIDLAFHSFRMDMRVSPSFKIAWMILDIGRKLSGLSGHKRHIIVDKIAFEIRGALEACLQQRSTIEAMNLLIAASEPAFCHAITPDLLDRVIAHCREQQVEAHSQSKRLTYWEIVSILYFIGGKAAYAKTLQLVVKDAETALTDLDPRKFSETAHLLLDLISCPHLLKDCKNRFTELAMKHRGGKPKPTDIAAFRTFVSDHTWFFHWNQNNILKTLLKKKELLLSY